ncbi:hypothetical protein K8R33_00950, partial [archaeon]|nr:hypothetical protein [archaeon]
MKKGVLFLVLVLFFVNCVYGDLPPGFEQSIRDSAGATVSPPGSRTCGDITHPNCVEVSSCGFYNYPSGAYLLLTQDLSDTMSCIFLGGDVTLDLNGYTITYQDANYPMIPNYDFEGWTGGVPDYWDVSLAPSIEQRDQDDIRIVEGNNAFMAGGETIVSDWVYLPVANRHYRGMIVFRAGADANGPTIQVESEQNGIVCTLQSPNDSYGEGRTAFCDFDDQPVGNYRLRVTTVSSTYLDLAGIVPAHDLGIGSIRIYAEGGCNSYTGVSTCHAPDYLGQSGVIAPDVIIKDGYITSGAFSHNSRGFRFSDLLGGTVHVENVRVDESGIDSKTAHITSSGSISYSTFYNYQPWITTRQSLSHCSISIGNGDFHHNYAEGGQGVINVGGDGARIHDNVLRNDQAVTNHYTIMMGGHIGSAEIYNNVFDPIRGSGILLFKADNNLVYNNVFYSEAQPCNPEYNNEDYSTNAIRINDYYENVGVNNEIYNNLFYLSGEYYYDSAHPLCRPLSSGIFHSNSGDGTSVHDNDFYLTKKNDNDLLYVYGLYIGGMAYNNPVNNRVFYNNYFEANDEAVWISSFYGSSTDMWIENNTFVSVPNIYYTPSYPDAAIQIGYYDHLASNIRLINNKFLGGFNSDSYQFRATESIAAYDLTKINYLNVNVLDDNQNPITNAFVRAVPQGSGSEINGYTDSIGYVRLDLVEYTESGDSRPSGVHNRVMDAPYDIYVSSTYYTQVNANNEETINIVGSEVTEICGDGIIQTPNDAGINEVCDGTNFNGVTCANYGYSAGSLSCINNCQTINSDNCYDEPDCTFTSASWSDSEVEEGIQVSLTINGANCEGETISLELYEVDDWLVFTDYDLVSGTSFPTEATFSGNQINLNWVTKWVEDSGGVDSDPEYVFRAIFGEETIEPSDYLKVTLPSTGEPHVDSVSNSGVLSDGGIFSISGGDFGVKSPVGPLSWDNFEGHSDGQVIKGVSPVVGFTWTSGTTTSIEPYVKDMSSLPIDAPSGSKTVVVDWNDNTQSYFGWGSEGPYDEIYFNFKRYLDVADPNILPINHKVCYVFGNGQCTNGAYQCPTAMIGAIMPTRPNWQSAIQNNPTTNFDWVGSGDSFSETSNVWNKMEQYAKTESVISADDGAISTWFDGKRVVHEEYINLQDVDGKFRAIDIGNMYQGFGAQSYVRTYFDDVYVDNTWARVEICDVSSWSQKESNGAHCEIQIPHTTWDGSTIEFTVNQGSFSLGEDAYLFVIDENGVASNGYPVSFDGVAPECGDGVREGGEQCDAGVDLIFGTSDDDIGIATCVSEGFDSGDLACESGCTTFDTSGCTECDSSSDCDDDNICTNDVCNLEGVCEYTNNTIPCDDGDDCTENDICSAGSCIPGTEITSCINGDGCCPSGCTIDNDNDCTPVSPDDAVLYLPLDSDYNDHSDSALSVSCVSCPTQTLGQIDGAYSFDGVDNYLDFEDSLNGLTLPVTLAAWVNLADLDSVHPIIRTDDSTNYAGYFMFITPVADSGGKIYAGFGDDGGDTSTFRRIVKSDGGILNVGEWAHIAAVISGVDDILLYLDGDLITTSYDGSAGSPVATSDHLVVGRRSISSGSNFAGSLDEVRIYDRALLESEIEEIMVGESSSTCTDGDSDGY